MKTELISYFCFLHHWSNNYHIFLASCMCVCMDLNLELIMLIRNILLWRIVLRSTGPVPDPVSIFLHQVFHFPSSLLEVFIRLKTQFWIIKCCQNNLVIPTWTWLLLNAHIFTCHSRGNKVGIKNMNDYLILGEPAGPCLSGMQCFLLFCFWPLTFLLWHVKMSVVKV